MPSTNPHKEASIPLCGNRISKRGTENIGEMRYLVFWLLRREEELRTDNVAHAVGGKDSNTDGTSLCRTGDIRGDNTQTEWDVDRENSNKG